MAGNNFCNFNNSHYNSNTRRNDNRVYESQDAYNNRSRTLMNHESCAVDPRFGDSDYSNFPNSEIRWNPPLVNSTTPADDTCFPLNNSLLNTCPPNMLPPDAPVPPPLQIYPPLQNAFPPFVPTGPFPPFVAPPGLPPFPPPGPSTAPPLYPTLSNSSNFPVFPPIDTSLPPPTAVSSKVETPSIQGWLKNLGIQRNTTLKKSCDNKIKLSISDYRRKVANLTTLLRELEKLTTHLQVMSKSLDDKLWLARKTEITQKKKAVEIAIDDLKTVPETEILSLLEKRKSKRRRLKRKREEYKEAKKDMKASCQLEHSRIDMWLEKMKEQVERTRTEEDIKKQADYVLSEVFYKKAEAKRVLSLLTTLGKLRNARIHDRESKGEFVSKEAAAAFNTIIESLKKRWLKQIVGYNMEEQGLRVMLSDAQVKRSNVEMSLNKQIHQEWLRTLFGDKRRDNPSNVQDLISVRKSWDRFIDEESNGVLGSSIPCGWILPVLPSSEIWSSFLKN